MKTSFLKDIGDYEANPCVRQADVKIVNIIDNSAEIEYLHQYDDPWPETVKVKLKCGYMDHLQGYEKFTDQDYGAHGLVKDRPVLVMQTGENEYSIVSIDYDRMDDPEKIQPCGAFNELLFFRPSLLTQNGWIGYGGDYLVDSDDQCQLYNPYEHPKLTDFDGNPMQVTTGEMAGTSGSTFAAFLDDSDDLIVIPYYMKPFDHGEDGTIHGHSYFPENGVITMETLSVSGTIATSIAKYLEYGSNTIKPIVWDQFAYQQDIITGYIPYSITVPATPEYPAITCSGNSYPIDDKIFFFSSILDVSGNIITRKKRRPYPARGCINPCFEDGLGFGELGKRTAGSLQEITSVFDVNTENLTSSIQVGESIDSSARQTAFSVYINGSYDHTVIGSSQWTWKGEGGNRFLITSNAPYTIGAHANSFEMNYFHNSFQIGSFLYASSGIGGSTTITCYSFSHVDVKNNVYVYLKLTSTATGEGVNTVANVTASLAVMINNTEYTIDTISESQISGYYSYILRYIKTFVFDPAYNSYNLNICLGSPGENACFDFRCLNGSDCYAVKQSCSMEFAYPITIFHSSTGVVNGSSIIYYHPVPIICGLILDESSTKTVPEAYYDDYSGQVITFLARGVAEEEEELVFVRKSLDERLILLSVKKFDGSGVNGKSKYANFLIKDGVNIDMTDFFSQMNITDQNEIENIRLQ